MAYQSGFGNHFETESIKGTLPKGMNSPQKPEHGLYAEQLSGTAFTAPRAKNQRSWLYRIHPAVVQGEFIETGHSTWISSEKFGKVIRTPAPLRFNEFPFPTAPKDFWDSLYTYVLNGSPESKTGCAIHLYACNQSMKNRFAYNADAEMMIVPQLGAIKVKTELGVLELEPNWIGVIPRGVKFTVELTDTQARGYVCENFGLPFALPDLGPIGANGLANARDFETPVAAFEDQTGSFELFTRYQGSNWRAELKHSPLDVVAWHGNYAPYRYDLRKYNTIGSISFDHPDPSIFTVMTSPSLLHGTANIDFVIFTERWMVSENTFRPPYYHRNVMNEFMGLVHGKYDAKPDGFVPGGASVHNCMTGHGPDKDAFEKATAGALKPEKYSNTLAFMWESVYPFLPTEQVIRSSWNQKNYSDCWQNLPKLFRP